MATEKTDTLYKPPLPNMYLYVEIFICYKKAHLPSLKLQRCWFSEERSSNSKHLIEVGSADANVEGTLIAASCMLNSHMKLCVYYGCDYKRGNDPTLSPNHFIVSPRFPKFLSFRLPQSIGGILTYLRQTYGFYIISLSEVPSEERYYFSHFFCITVNKFFRGIWWNCSAIWYDCSKEGMTHWPLSLRAVWSRIQPAIWYNSRGLSTSTRTSVTCFVKLGGGSWGRNDLNNTLPENSFNRKTDTKTLRPRKISLRLSWPVISQKMTHAYIQVPL